MTTIEKANFAVLLYTILIFPTIVGFAIIFYTMRGAVISEFSTFLGSFLEIFRMIIGNFKFLDIIYVENIYGFIYLLLFYIFALHFVIVVFVSLILSSFRSTIDIYSYPGDMRDYKKWGLKDYLKWSLSFLPSKLLMKLGFQTSLAESKNPEKDEEKKETPGYANTQDK